MPQRIVWATSRRDGVPWMGFVEGYPGWCKFEDVKSGEPCAAVCTRSEDAAWVCPLSYTLSDSRSSEALLLGKSVPATSTVNRLNAVSPYLDALPVPSRAPERDAAAGEPGPPPGEDAERREEAHGAPRQARHEREGQGEARHLSPTPAHVRMRVQRRRHRLERPQSAHTSVSCCPPYGFIADRLTHLSKVMSLTRRPPQGLNEGIFDPLDG